MADPKAGHLRFQNGHWQAYLGAAPGIGGIASGWLPLADLDPELDAALQGYNAVRYTDTTDAQGKSISTTEFRRSPPPMGPGRQYPEFENQPWIEWGNIPEIEAVGIGRGRGGLPGTTTMATTREPTTTTPVAPTREPTTATPMPTTGGPDTTTTGDGDKVTLADEELIATDEGLTEREKAVIEKIEAAGGVVPPKPEWWDDETGEVWPPTTTAMDATGKQTVVFDSKLYAKMFQKFSPTASPYGPYTNRDAAIRAQRQNPVKLEGYTIKEDRERGEFYFVKEPTGGPLYAAPRGQQWRQRDGEWILEDIPDLPITGAPPYAAPRGQQWRQRDGEWRLEDIPDLPSSIDDAITRALLKGDWDAARAFADFQDRPTAMDRFDMAMRFSESDADFDTLKKALEFFGWGRPLEAADYLPGGAREQPLLGPFGQQLTAEDIALGTTKYTTFPGFPTEPGVTPTTTTGVPPVDAEVLWGEGDPNDPNPPDVSPGHPDYVAPPPGYVPSTISTVAGGPTVISPEQAFVTAYNKVIDDWGGTEEEAREAGKAARQTAEAQAAATITGPQPGVAAASGLSSLTQADAAPEAAFEEARDKAIMARFAPRLTAEGFAERYGQPFQEVTDPIAHEAAQAAAQAAGNAVADNGGSPQQVDDAYEDAYKATYDERARVRFTPSTMPAGTEQTPAAQALADTLKRIDPSQTGLASSTQPNLGYSIPGVTHPYLSKPYRQALAQSRMEEALAGKFTSAGGRYIDPGHDWSAFQRQKQFIKKPTTFAQWRAKPEQIGSFGPVRQTAPSRASEIEALRTLRRPTKKRFAPRAQTFSPV